LRENARLSSDSEECVTVYEDCKTKNTIYGTKIDYNLDILYIWKYNVIVIRNRKVRGENGL